MLINKYLLKIATIFGVLIVSLTGTTPISHASSNQINLGNDIRKAISNQTELGVNADQIDDGAVYFIHSASNSNLVWDVPANNYSNGTAPILYSKLGWGNQRFVVHEETEYNSKTYYTITPLYSPETTLILNSNNENETLKLGKDNNGSLQGFLSNKFIIEKSTYGYTISTGVSSFGKYIVPKDDNISSNNTLVQKTITNATTNKKYQWLFCKTDTLGNDLKNKIRINGRSKTVFNLTPPSTGEFIIETEKCGSDEIDTYLELHNQDGQRLAFNDDISRPSNLYSRIIYNFETTDDLKVMVNGFDNEDIGYVYLTLRPKNALYFAGVYDFDKNNNDRPGSLKKVKPYFPNYYIEVQGNRGTSAILETASNGKKKMNCEYFVFSGHGYSNAAGVEFYNGTFPEGFMWYKVPKLDGTKIAIWMTCHGARNYFKYGNSGTMTSMAYQSIEQGAEYSLGYVGEIYDPTLRSFPENFFEALNNGMTIPEAVNQGTEWAKTDNWWWWTFFGQFNDDFKNPILYKKGDQLKTSCGTGTYAKANSIEKQTSIGKNNYLYVDNTGNGESISYISTQSNSANSIARFVPFVFKTNYMNKTYELGFNCNPSTGRVNYYNLTLNSQITSFEFEKMMGKPTINVLNSIKSFSLNY